MKVKNRHLSSPRRSLGVKRWLLALNRDLDRVKHDISFNKDFGRCFCHSVSIYGANLSNIEIAILYLEDRRFFSHGGFEFRSALRAVKRMFTRGSLGGMSTIDQQVVRISLKRHERTFSRKFNEISLAIFLNFHETKRDIFDYYIHNAYLGHRMEGCEVAARKIFGISAAEMTREQAGFVASLFPLPFPRSLWQAYVADPRYPMFDPEKIISLGDQVAPRWASRVRFRMGVALQGYDRMPKSL